MSRVLLLDDSAFVLAFARGALGAAGYEVLTAEDWISVRRILALNEPIDLVLLDVNLPGMQDGTHLVVSLARHPTTVNAKLVLFSGKPAAELAKLAEAPGLAGYIVKTGVADELKKAVEGFIGPPKPLTKPPAP